MDEALDRHEALRAIRAYCNGDVGVPYPALQRFASPIYDLYGIEARSTFDSAPARELRDHLSVMETARLFWWYFGSGAESNADLSARVRALLIGEQPSQEQEAAFAVLVERLHDNWSTIPRALRQINGHTCNTISLSRLLDELEPETSDEPAPTPPSGAVDSPEALAVFASPLLEDPTVEDDPDRISEMMGRARDYWHLAQLNGPDFERQQIAIAEKYGKTEEERQFILAEAGFMVARFHMLFPHWTEPRRDT